MDMNKFNKSGVYERVMTKISNVETETGCLLWNELPVRRQISFEKKNYSPQWVIWANKHPLDVIDSRSQEIFRHCNDTKCFNVKHFDKRTKVTVTKESVWKRIQKKIVPQENGCSHWNGAYKNGYASTSIGKDNIVSLHRAVFWIHSDYEYITDIPQYIDVDGIPITAHVRHLCGDSKCILPQHLDIGTIYQNNNEDKKNTQTLVCGEKNSMSLISQRKAVAIIDALIKGKKVSIIAEHEQVSRDIVYEIKNYRSWTHLWPDQETIKHFVSKQLNRRRASRGKAANRNWSNEMFDEAYKLINSQISIGHTIEFNMTSPCHLFPSVDLYGYGIMHIHGRRKVKTHILVAQIVNNYIRPKGLMVLHKCNIRACCNPDHLVFGTAKENAKDRIEHRKKAEASIMNICDP